MFFILFKHSNNVERQRGLVIELLFSHWVATPVSVTPVAELDLGLFFSFCYLLLYL